LQEIVIIALLGEGGIACHEQQQEVDFFHIPNLYEKIGRRKNPANTTFQYLTTPEKKRKKTDVFLS
jgi:hypothetical protein